MGEFQEAGIRATGTSVPRRVAASFNRSNSQLDHERLDVYTAAVDLNGAVVALARKAGRGRGWLGDQATRASASVVLNPAEALGREGLYRARTLRIARGSALEVDAAPTLLLHRGACRAEARATVKTLTVRVVAILTVLRNRAAP